MVTFEGLPPQANEALSFFISAYAGFAPLVWVAVGCSIVGEGVFVGGGARVGWTNVNVGYGVSVGYGVGGAGFSGTTGGGGTVGTGVAVGTPTGKVHASEMTTKAVRDIQ